MLWTRLLASDGVSALPVMKMQLRHFSPHRLLRQRHASKARSSPWPAPISLCGKWRHSRSRVVVSPGVILFSDSLKPLHRVSASGGEATPVVYSMPCAGKLSSLFLFFLPDNQHFLYASFAKGKTA